MTLITRAWLEEQVIKLSAERDKARLEVAEARIKLGRAQREHMAAFDTLDALDNCVKKMQAELDRMDGKKEPVAGVWDE